MKNNQEQTQIIPSYDEKEIDEGEGSQLEKIEPRHNFIIVYDTIYKNSDLTTDEIAILIKLISASPNFKPTGRKLANILKIDYKRLLKATNSLQEKGYLKIQNLGKGKGAKWTISQAPTLKAQGYTFEDLKGLLNVDYYYQLLKARLINFDLYKKLVENVIEIARIEWIDKGERKR